MILLSGSLNLVPLSREKVAGVRFEDFLGCAFFSGFFAFCLGAAFFSLATDLGELFVVG